MIFNSTTFLLFLSIITVAYWMLRGQARLWLLFLSSLLFYAFWRWEFVGVMLLSAVVDFIVSRAMPGAPPARRKALLGISLLINLGLLLYFKYTYFFLENAQAVLDLYGFNIETPTFDIVLPLGISFYTFQTISYTVDVYRGVIKPQRSFVLYATYVTYFPQLVAGPILRAREVITQLAEDQRFDLDNLSIGARRILSGLFLKVVLADNIAPLVDSGFAMEVSVMSALDVWTLAFLFGFQIYFDFSAYSHIAIGTARLMGIRFPENFNFPYCASSPREFWKRWHISLSSWIRDYLYLPLTGNKIHDHSTGGLGEATEHQERKKQRVRHATQSLFVTWALMGLWHGANWTFVFWGVYHASFIYIYRLGHKYTSINNNIIRRAGGWALTLPIVMLSWIPFRARSLPDALSMYAALFDPGRYLWLGMRETTYLIAFLLFISVTAAYFMHRHLRDTLMRQWRMWFLLETAMISVITALVIIYLRPINQFIYFQF